MKKWHLILTLALVLGLLVGLTGRPAVLAAYPGQKIQIPTRRSRSPVSTSRMAGAP